MSVSKKTVIALWTVAAGRCQYRGCNTHLLGDLLSGRTTLNKAYVAHIVAQDPDGPRGDPLRSPMLADAVENVMLMCDAHHRLIDRDGLADHPEAVLRAMKVEHEARIAAVTGISHDRGSHVLLYGARVGSHDVPVRFELAKAAMFPDRYPLEERPIQLSTSGVDLKDSDPAYWLLQQSNLRRQFSNRVTERLATGDVKHLSVFALAPQPLLIELGRLLGDIAQVSVRQLYREPQTWEWRGGRPIELIVREPASSASRVALKLGLSATITDERIRHALGDDIAIWSIETALPDRDVIGSETDLAAFRYVLRQTYDRIKARHGEEPSIHLFPAVPVSAAVEIGRVWMPKADLPLVIYDQERSAGGFVERLTIGREAHFQPADGRIHKELTHG